MVQRLLLESSLRLHIEEFPLGEETGLPLIPNTDCGLARVIERHIAKETTKNYLRLFFKCPCNGVSMCCLIVLSIPHLCVSYKVNVPFCLL